MAHFHFHDLQSNPTLNQNDYIFIRPTAGSLGPKEKMTLDITILIGNNTIPVFAGGRTIDDIIILEIKNGRHIFLSLQGSFQPTCFGQSLDRLSSYGGKGCETSHQGDPYKLGVACLTNYGE
jgi:phosphatidylinositol-bisphosphatase